MTPLQEVISRKLAEALKAAGVPQGQSHYVWWRNYLDHGYILDRRDDAVLVEHTYDALTFNEVIELLGDQFHALVAAVVGFNAQQAGVQGIGVCAPTPQDAAGQLLLMLWESHAIE